MKDGIVSTAVLNVRMIPAGKIVGRLKLNDKVKVVNKDKEWLEIEFNGASRFVMREFVFLRGDPTTSGRVKPRALRVRHRPDAEKGQVIGTIRQKQKIRIIEEKNNWLKILVDKEYIGYALKDFIDFDAEDDEKQEVEQTTENQEVLAYVRNGTINASPRLRIRQKPDGDVVGNVSYGAHVQVLVTEGEWLKIKYHEIEGYVFAKYVDFWQATIDSFNARIKDKPSEDGRKIGKIHRNEVVDIIEDAGDYIKIVYDNKYGYISKSDIKQSKQEREQEKKQNTKEEPIIVSGEFLWQDRELQKIDLEPRKKIDVEGSNERQAVARIYNNYGNLIEELSQKLQMDPAVALAVFQAESGGSGFIRNRLIIRFENHIFYDYWGKYNPADFKEHFRYNPGVRFKDHYFREKKSGEWEKQHSFSSQDQEWRVLEFARSLDDTAALKSISMGAPQIMGLNHAVIGYSNVQDMFHNFNNEIRFQIIGFFDFCKASQGLINAMHKRDFVTFALYYNGKGQEQLYGNTIKRYYQALASVV